MYRDFALSVRGYSHVKEDLKCQDSAVAIKEESGAWALAVAADGHGGKAYFRSDVGSRIAVECAEQVVRDYLADLEAFVKALNEDSEKVLRGMEASILSKWNSAVQEYDAQHKELTEWEEDWCTKKQFTVNEQAREKLYGTTLVMSVLSPQFAIGIQNGDGACAAIYENAEAEFFLPQEDGEHALNITQSLSSSVAMERFVHRCELAPLTSAGKAEEEPEAEPCDTNNEEMECADLDGGEAAEACPAKQSPRLPVCLMVSTDGLINSCMSPEDFLKFNRRVLSLIDETDFGETLERHLFDERSTKGSQDDISIAMVFEEGLNLADFRPS